MVRVFLVFVTAVLTMVLLQLIFEAFQLADSHSYASITQFISMCNMLLKVFNDLARGNRRGTKNKMLFSFEDPQDVDWCQHRIETFEDA